MNNLYITIGKNIKKFREECGVSQFMLAEVVGYKTAVPISLIESGKRKISVEKLLKVSEVLGKTLDDFIKPKHYKCSVCSDSKEMLSWGHKVKCVFCYE